MKVPVELPGVEISKVSGQNYRYGFQRLKEFGISSREVAENVKSALGYIRPEGQLYFSAKDEQVNYLAKRFPDLNREALEAIYDLRDLIPDTTQLEAEAALAQMAREGLL